MTELEAARMRSHAPSPVVAARGALPIAAWCVALIVGFSLGCASGRDVDPLDAELAKAQKERTGTKPAVCHPGIVEACYSGPTGTAGRGICREGRHTCDPDGQWMTCEGEVKPGAMELCNNRDDDCNGVVDDGFSREGTKCWAGEGECRADGEYKCSTDGATSTCTAQPKPPKAEICDGKDNDCDGKVDEEVEGTGVACKTGKPGVCATGTKECVGAKIECVQTVAGSPEVCGNNIDEDCDGQVDEKDCVAAGAK